jgi:hypothetical protein
MRNTVTPGLSKVTRLAKSRFIWTQTNRIFCLQQELIGPLVTGKKAAELAAVVMSLTADAVNDGTQIQLGAKYVKHQVAVDARGRKHGLIYLEGMGAFRRFHRQVDDGVELDGHLVNLDGLKRPEDKHTVCLWCSGTRHGNNRWRQAYHTKRQWGSAGYGAMAIAQQGKRAMRGAVGLPGGRNIWR